VLVKRPVQFTEFGQMRRKRVRQGGGQRFSGGGRPCAGTLASRTPSYRAGERRSEWPSHRVAQAPHLGGLRPALAIQVRRGDACSLQGITHKPYGLPGRDETGARAWSDLSWVGSATQPSWRLKAASREDAEKIFRMRWQWAPPTAAAPNGGGHHQIPIFRSFAFAARRVGGRQTVAAGL